MQCAKQNVDPTYARTRARTDLNLEDLQLALRPLQLQVQVLLGGSRRQRLHEEVEGGKDRTNAVNLAKSCLRTPTAVLLNSHLNAQRTFFKLARPSMSKILYDGCYHLFALCCDCEQQT